MKKLKFNDGGQQTKLNMTTGTSQTAVGDHPEKIIDTVSTNQAIIDGSWDGTYTAGEWKGGGVNSACHISNAQVLLDQYERNKGRSTEVKNKTNDLQKSIERGAEVFKRLKDVADIGWKTDGPYSPDGRKLQGGSKLSKLISGTISQAEINDVSNFIREFYHLAVCSKNDYFMSVQPRKIGSGQNPNDPKKGECPKTFTKSFTFQGHTIYATYHREDTVLAEWWDLLKKEEKKEEGKKTEESTVSTKSISEIETEIENINKELSNLENYSYEESAQENIDRGTKIDNLKNKRSELEKLKVNTLEKENKESELKGGPIKKSGGLLKKVFKLQKGKQFNKIKGSKMQIDRFPTKITHNDCLYILDIDLWDREEESSSSSSSSTTESSASGGCTKVDSGEYCGICPDGTGIVVNKKVTQIYLKKGNEKDSDITYKLVDSGNDFAEDTFQPFDVKDKSGVVSTITIKQAKIAVSKGACKGAGGGKTGGGGGGGGGGTGSGGSGKINIAKVVAEIKEISCDKLNAYLNSLSEKYPGLEKDDVEAINKAVAKKCCPLSPEEIIKTMLSINCDNFLATKNYLECRGDVLIKGIYYDAASNEVKQNSKKTDEFSVRKWLDHLEKYICKGTTPEDKAAEGDCKAFLNSFTPEDRKKIHKAFAKVNSISHTDQDEEELRTLLGDNLDAFMSKCADNGDKVSSVASNAKSQGKEFGDVSILTDILTNPTVARLLSTAALAPPALPYAATAEYLLNKKGGPLKFKNGNKMKLKYETGGDLLDKYINSKSAQRWETAGDAIELGSSALSFMPGIGTAASAIGGGIGSAVRNIGRFKEKGNTEDFWNEAAADMALTIGTSVIPGGKLAKFGLKGAGMATKAAKNFLKVADDLPEGANIIKKFAQSGLNKLDDKIYRKTLNEELLTSPGVKQGIWGRGKVDVNEARNVLSKVNAEKMGKVDYANLTDDQITNLVNTGNLTGSGKWYRTFRDVGSQGFLDHLAKNGTFSTENSEDFGAYGTAGLSAFRGTRSKTSLPSLLTSSLGNLITNSPKEQLQFNEDGTISEGVDSWERSSQILRTLNPFARATTFSRMRKPKFSTKSKSDVADPDVDLSNTGTNIPKPQTNAADPAKKMSAETIGKAKQMVSYIKEKQRESKAVAQEKVATSPKRDPDKFKALDIKEDNLIKEIDAAKNRLKRLGFKSDKVDMIKIKKGSKFPKHSLGAALSGSAASSAAGAAAGGGGLGGLVQSLGGVEGITGMLGGLMGGNKEQQQPTVQNNANTNQLQQTQLIQQAYQKGLQDGMKNATQPVTNQTQPDYTQTLNKVGTQPIVKNGAKLLKVKKINLNKTR